MKKEIKMALKESWIWFFVGYSIFATIYTIFEFDKITLISGAIIMGLIIFAGEFIRKSIKVK